LVGDNGGWRDSADGFFFPDATGTFDGPMRMPTTWRVDGDRLCVRKSLLLKSKCVTFRRSGTGLKLNAGLGRANLYKALSPDGNPEFTAVVKVFKALGLRLLVCSRSLRAHPGSLDS
jgi:hypothetical protein